MYVIGSILPFLWFFILSAAIVAHFYEAMQLCNPPLHPTNVPTPRSDPRSDSYLLDVYMRHHSVLPHFPSSFLHQSKIRFSINLQPLYTTHTHISTVWHWIWLSLMHWRCRRIKVTYSKSMTGVQVLNCFFQLNSAPEAVVSRPFLHHE